MTVNKYFQNPQYTAAELFSAGYCNLNCTYCYIPKRPFLKDVHQGILTRIRNGGFLKDLKSIYGEDLEFIGHWGTEPTLSIKEFIPFYKEAVKVFPKLKSILMSSNFMIDPENLISFIRELPSDRPLKVDIQISLDGPAWVTDKNRGLGTTVSIIENTKQFIHAINQLETPHDLIVHVKPTMDEKDISEFSKYSRMKEYYVFFDVYFSELFNLNTNNKISILTHCDPTISVPGNYDRDTGINFKSMLENQVKLKEISWKHITSPESAYYNRWAHRASYFGELFTKPRMFTCSSGDTQLGIMDKSGLFGSCHRMFYVNNPEYEKAVLETGLDKTTLRGVSTGGNQALKEHMIADINNGNNVVKFLYINRAFHDFISQFLASGTAIAMELAHSGLISPCYKDRHLATLLTLGTKSANCYLDEKCFHGSSYISSFSYFLLFGNGYFENILRRSLIKNVNER